jgi:RNA polymerase sigma factor (sigma-70 family)
MDANRAAADDDVDALALPFHQGDPESVRELYRLTGKAAFSVAYRVLENRSLAEDAVQQAFLSAWRSRDRLDPSRGIRLWLFSIVKRAALDVQRRERLRTHGNIDDAASHPALIEDPPGIEQAWEAWRVREALERLPPDERELVRLQHFVGLTHTEIAERLDMPLGTVKSRSHRAHHRLAEQLRALREVKT